MGSVLLERQEADALPLRSAGCRSGRRGATQGRYARRQSLAFRRHRHERRRRIAAGVSARMEAIHDSTQLARYA